ncbi:cobalamin biosynthesis protein CobG [Aestuariivita sp.]|uniref:cobalamin biosynthesis protein CobG n=1 Tax=Aestuariivita sp. TaxID=1872407 RepID=UPI00216F02B9|nr:cobalamin biosynthesis protein CobG [Aestuariivita sp.]MCE8009618.1 cobalamin biosynthesis protein CobG [Aestuariivita sp.]
MSVPGVKGWCPGAHRPMVSGDGLVVRVRPWHGRLSPEHVFGICDLADRFGSGIIDVTRRANVQIRGVSPEGFPALLEGLDELGLLDADADLEARRNVLVTPFHQEGDLTHRLARAVVRTLPRLPDLPAKIGYAVDTGPFPILREEPADIRFERAGDGSLIIRLDGTDAGRAVTEAGAMDALVEAAEWLARGIGPDARRMAKVVTKVRPPESWVQIAPVPPGPRPEPGRVDQGVLLGVPLGRTQGGDLRDLVRQGGAVHLRMTPWRMVLLETQTLPDHPAFIESADDPILAIDACPGAPYCSVATVETRALARRLAGKTGGALHISGCAKGCARSAPADVTLVGRNGAFDLVRNGHAWDDPQTCGLVPDDLLAQFHTS